MAGFAESYLGQLRQLVGARLLLVPGARIVIENGEGAVLLQRRSDFGVWGLPGGNAEPGEDLATVIQREVFEETGLTIADPVPFGFASSPALETIVFPNGDACQFFVLNFCTSSFSGTLSRHDDETADLAWVMPDALPEMLPNMAASLRAYANYRETGRFQIVE